MRHREIVSLEAHPNRAEIEEVLTRLPQLTDIELERLGAAWLNTSRAVAARAKAMSPDAPLVLEALGAIETAEFLYLPGDGEALRPMAALTRSHAVQAIRDAVTAAYGRPVIGRVGHRELMRAWREAVPTGPPAPLLGPATRRVLSVLEIIAAVAAECHDPVAAGLFDELDTRAHTLDHETADAARAEVAGALAITGRQRTARFVARAAAGRLPWRCPTCHAPVDPRRYEAVVRLCSDAAVALLVADVVDASCLDALLSPLGSAVAGSGGPVGR